MPKTITFHESGQIRALRGAEKLARAVSVTIGPRGRRVSVSKGNRPPLVTNKGFEIAAEIVLSDRIEQIGVDLLKDAARRTKLETGGGASMTIVLAHRLAREGIKSVLAGANPLLLKQGMEKAAALAIERLKELSNRAQLRFKIADVAMTSCGDAELTAQIALAFQMVGRDGLITIEDGHGTGLELEFVEGAQFENGFLSPYFVTDSEGQQAIIEDPYILIHEHEIASSTGLLSLLERMQNRGYDNLVVIADDVRAEALSLLVVNKLNNTMGLLAIRSPGFGLDKKAVLEDIAILTGGRLIASEMGRSLDNVSIGELGRASRVIATRKHTTLLGGMGRRSEIEARIRGVRSQLDTAESDFVRERLQNRLAILTGNMALLRVGGITGDAARSRRLLAEDAIAAIRAAHAEGVVPGGGAALLSVLSETDSVSSGSPDEMTGFQIVTASRTSLLQAIAENAGYEGHRIVAQLDEMQSCSGNPMIGFDCNHGRYVDMLKAGIVDPTAAVRAALRNAVSVAGMLISSEVFIADSRK